MRKMLFVLLGGILFGGCQLVDIATGIPSAPKDLKGNVISMTEVDLSWIDKSINEEGFEIGRKKENENEFILVGKVGKNVNKFRDLGLLPNTTYVYVVQSYNADGRSSSNEIIVKTVSALPNSCGSAEIHNPDLIYGEVKDVEGNTYKTIKIGTQTWMAENLRTKKYNDGSLITYMYDNGNLAEGSYIFSGAVDKCSHGLLYNWVAVDDPRGLAPTGWHIPSDAEWATLINFLGGKSIAGNKMKTPGELYWLRTSDINKSASNISGFSALGSGWGSAYPASIDQMNVSRNAAFWGSTQVFYLQFNKNEIYTGTRDVTGISLHSIRCIKD